MLVSEVDHIYFICWYSFPRFSVVCRCPFSFDGVKYGASQVKYGRFSLNMVYLTLSNPQAQLLYQYSRTGGSLDSKYIFRRTILRSMGRLYISRCLFVILCCHLEQIWTNESLSIIIKNTKLLQNYCHLPTIHKPTQFTYM